MFSLLNKTLSIEMSPEEWGRVLAISGDEEVTDHIRRDLAIKGRPVKVAGDQKVYMPAMGATSIYAKMKHAKDPVAEKIMDALNQNHW
jgi:hypothetical protein